MFGEKLLVVWLWLHSRKRSFLKNERGASAIEYALIVGLIAATLIGVLTAFGTEINELFQGIIERIESENGSE